MLITKKSGQGDVKYYSSNENVIKINEDGELTAVGNGQAEIKAFVISVKLFIKV